MYLSSEHHEHTVWKLSLHWIHFRNAKWISGRSRAHCAPNLTLSQKRQSKLWLHCFQPSGARHPARSNICSLHTPPHYCQLSFDGLKMFFRHLLRSKYSSNSPSKQKFLSANFHIFCKFPHFRIPKKTFAIKWTLHQHASTAITRTQTRLSQQKVRCEITNRPIKSRSYRSQV